MKLIFWIQGFIIVFWIIETGYCDHQGKSKREKLDNLLKIIAKEDENTNIDDAENEWVEEEVKIREHNLHKRKKRKPSNTFKKFVGSKYYVATVLGIITVIMISCILHVLLCTMIVQKVKAMNDDRPNKKTLNNEFKRRLSGIISTSLPPADSEQGAGLNLLPKTNQSEHTDDKNTLQQSVSLLMKIGVVPDNVDLQTKRKASTIENNNANYSKGHNTSPRKTYGTIPPSKKMSSSKTATSKSALFSSQSGNIGSEKSKESKDLSRRHDISLTKATTESPMPSKSQQEPKEVEPISEPTSTTSPKVPIVISTPESSKRRKPAGYQTRSQQTRVQVNPSDICAQPGPSPAQQSRIIPRTRTDTSSISSPIPSRGSKALITVMTAPSSIPLVTRVPCSVPLTMSMNNTSCQSDGSPVPPPPPPPPPSNDQKFSGKTKRNNLLQSIQGGQQLKSSQDQPEAVTKMFQEELDFLGIIRQGNTLKPATQNSVNISGHEKQTTKSKNILDSIREGAKLKSNAQQPINYMQENTHSEPVHQGQTLKPGNPTISTDISKISQPHNKNSSDPTDFLGGIRQGKTLKCANDRIILPKQDEGLILAQAVKSPKLKSVKQRIIPEAKKEEQMSDMLKSVKLKSVPPMNQQNPQMQEAIERRPKRSNAPPENLLADLTGTLRNKFPTVVRKTFTTNYQWQTQSLPFKQSPKPDRKTDVREITLEEIRQRPTINPNMFKSAFSK